MTIAQELLDLAPTGLAVRRAGRYDGGGFGVPLAAFAAEDRDLIRRVYAVVKAIHDVWVADRTARDDHELQKDMREAGTDAFAASAAALGTATAARGPSPEVRRALHDLRGGGLRLLVSTAALLRLGLPGPTLLSTCVALARDHARIMRHAVPDLDPAGRAHDAAPVVQDVGDVVRQWHGVTVQLNHRPVAVAAESSYHGGITASGLEAAALDRVLYNLLDNAARYTADGSVDLAIFPAGGAAVRWVVSNAVGPEPAAGGAGGLFEAGPAGGLGLSTCAAIVAACFGLASGGETVAGGYVGARLVGERFHAWFHWPALAPAAA
jgi:signal transduction histidine kinase